jgi:pimeloyl-ACP methyl ester carboxylesterase
MEFMALEPIFGLLVLLFILVVAYYLINKKIFVERAKGDYFESHRGPICYKVWGQSGPFVVLIHGLGASSFCWRHLAPELAQDFRVLVFDLWGFGNSSMALEKEINIDDQTQIILDLMRYLRIPSAHIVGHSMGGEIAMWLAIKQDKRVKSLVAIAPAIDPTLVPDTIKKVAWLAGWTPWLVSKKIVKQSLKRVVFQHQLITPEVVDGYYAPYQNPDAHLCFVSSLEIIKDHRVFEQIGSIQCPTLLLWGEQDRVVGLHILNNIKTRLPHAQWSTHPKAGHMPMEDQPQWILDQIKTYLFSR